MRLPSISSLLLASLVVSSSSLSALAAPVGVGQEESSSNAAAAAADELVAKLRAELQHVPRSLRSDETIVQPNGEPPVAPPAITFLSNPAKLCPIKTWELDKVGGGLAVNQGIGSM